MGFAFPGTCGSGCSYLLLPFMVLLAITSFIAAFSQTPSFMMILRCTPTTWTSPRNNPVCCYVRVQDFFFSFSFFNLAFQSVVIIKTVKLVYRNSFHFQKSCFWRVLSCVSTAGQSLQRTNPSLWGFSTWCSGCSVSPRVTTSGFYQILHSHLRNVQSNLMITNSRYS